MKLISRCKIRRLTSRQRHIESTTSPTSMTHQLYLVNDSSIQQLDINDFDFRFRRGREVALNWWVVDVVKLMGRWRGKVGKSMLHQRHIDSTSPCQRLNFTTSTTAQPYHVNNTSIQQLDVNDFVELMSGKVDGSMTWWSWWVDVESEDLTSRQRHIDSTTSCKWLTSRPREE